MIRLPHKLVALRTAILFLSVYLVSLAVWIPVKDRYGYAITVIASKLAAGLKDARLEEITADKDIIQTTFSPYRKRSGVLVDIPVPVSAYTFNAPLTFGIMAALYPFISRRARAYGEALVMLLFVHFLFVFSLEAKELTQVFMSRGIVALSLPRLMLYQFLWSFVDNMVIRFEPFLIGFYVYVRFGAKGAAEGGPAGRG
ncbi:MAG: hypothetical protein M0Z79_01865 [Nitrospiraceae bacterium]|nr:hypothetical protein [Nitrospiraceae bacterium]